MSAAKSGNHIYVSGSGNTLASITTDIADTTFIEKTASSPDIYTVKGNVARYLRIRNGGTLTIGDPLDYTDDESLEFENDAVDRTRFYVDTGGTLLMYGATKIDFSTSAFRPYYTYFYGKADILGDGTNNPTLQNYRRLYFYENQNNDTYSSDVWHFEDMTIGSSFTLNDYAMYFNVIGKVRSHIFKDILFDKTHGNGVGFYAMRLPYDIRGLRNITFENLDFNNVGNYPVYTTGARPHFKGCTFGTTTSWKMLTYGCGTANGSDTYGDYGYHGEHNDGQHFIYLEDATFENLANQNCLLAQYGSVVLCKDCTWEHTSGDSGQAAYGGVIMMWTGNTFSGVENWDVDYDGRVNWVHSLTLTINDENGDPLEDATVVIEQSGGKETLTFHTDAAGKMRNDHDLDCALLVHKHQYGNAEATNFEYWSDATNSTYHTATVYKAGYTPATEDYVMSEARSDTIQLELLSTGSKAINLSKRAKIK